jgi:hypothetical protein
VPDKPIFEYDAAQWTRKPVKYGDQLAFSGKNVSDLNKLLQMYKKSSKID